MLSVHRVMNHRYGPIGLQAGIYIYICTWLVYSTDTVPLGYGSVCHNSTFVRLLLVYQFILNSNSNVNILLRELKSFNTIYNSIYIHLYENRTFSHS